MQNGLTPTKETSYRGDVIRTERRILHYNRHRLHERRPIDVEPVGIERVLDDLACHPEEKRIVNVERFVQKRRQHGDRDRDQQPASFS